MYAILLDNSNNIMVAYLRRRQQLQFSGQHDHQTASLFQKLPAPLVRQLEPLHTRMALDITDGGAGVFQLGHKSAELGGFLRQQFAVQDQTSHRRVEKVSYRRCK